MPVADSCRLTKIQILERLLKNIWSFISMFFYYSTKRKVLYSVPSQLNKIHVIWRLVCFTAMLLRTYKSVRLVFVNHSDTECRWREYDSWNVTRSRLRQDNFLFLLRNFIVRNVRHVCIVQCLCMDDMQMAFCHVLCLKAGRRRGSVTLSRHKMRSCVSRGCVCICKFSSRLTLYESTYVVHQILTRLQAG